MRSFIYLDSFGHAEQVFCEACEFNLESGLLLDTTNFPSMISNVRELNDSGWEKLREVGGYICPRCAKKDYLRRIVENGDNSGIPNLPE